MNQFIENLHVIFHFISFVYGWLWSLSGGWQVLSYLIFFITGVYLFLVLIVVAFGYSYPNSTKKYIGSLNIPFINKFSSTDEDKTIRWLDLTMVFGGILFFLMCRYMPFIPFLKTALIGLLVTYLISYFLIFYLYGFLAWRSMLIMLVIVTVLAIFNISIGLPELVPHYKISDVTINPTDFDINFNQIYYILMITTGCLWVIAYTTNFFKWRKQEKPEGVINLDEYDIDTGKKKTAEQLYKVDSETFKYKLKQDLNLLCISANTQEHIFAKYTTLQISEFLEELRSLENTDNPKQYFLSKLEDLKNEKE